MKSLIFLQILFSFVYTRSINNRENIQILSVSAKTLNIHPLKDEIKLGQVGGVATSIKDKNELFIFHRGSREWNQYSFPDGIHFNRNQFGPIPEKTILNVNSQTGEIINQWGNNTFYMPHGLSIDHQGNFWLTDVAMHQVFKYSKDKLVLTLGELFVPGDDSTHFCKPTDVAISNTGEDIYVADGYCNSRIVKFDSKGKFIKQYRMPVGEKQLLIPHSLVLIESLQLICVADRENRRIVCFNTKTNEGKVKFIIEHPSIKTIYAITYNSNKNHLYAVSGKNQMMEAVGYTFSTNLDSFGKLLSIWKPQEKFGEPHDLTLSVDGQALFVGEIRPNLIRLFNNLD
ncbi:hypothetical protein I4U23_007943 [Adineta vaga]|nr:hypothetical protein I4U23_007943 [Adineta vaga]